ncbi:unnamed protein product [Triticum turgidum subsp. durum]|uniref:RRM domain-containing protein n=1 Tax=Triticum turgidum subsp. durum TaxID=4567 RepID=A0A9R0TJ92_TRITD|nr:unnamed protein product [Triticum turgidum subsp. durum]
MTVEIWCLTAPWCLWRQNCCLWHATLVNVDTMLYANPAEDLRVPFERFGPVRDVYLPKDYYSGEPRGFAFVEFVDPYDASEAQYHMNRQVFFGREITVVLAAESRKRPEDMRTRTRVRYIFPFLCEDLLRLLSCSVEMTVAGGTLEVMKGAVPLIMGGLVPVHAQPLPALVAVAVLGQGHTLLLQDGEMTTLLPHGEGSLIARNLLCVIQKNMRRTKGDPTLPLVEMVTNVMLIMGMRRGRHRPTVMDPLHAQGWPGHPQDRPLDPAPGPPTLLPPAATEKLVTFSAVAASPSSYFRSIGSSKTFRVENSTGSFDSQGLESVGIGNVQEYDVLSTEGLFDSQDCKSTGI